MRRPWCLLWLAILVAIVLAIPLIDRSSDTPRIPHPNQGQESPLLPVPATPDQTRP
ncbi:hypothetical protein [Rhizobium sp. SL86]|uniref:hypothetical protein n=1 Tax=Rhizobium sp. SL86 TaxID=2995148 RepID=UPI002275F82A|nr:hypothetical protein [Rhizobium sp. SL86]MCY1664268.1 hypothetical protein [Rhizobium sp. SL86]